MNEISFSRNKASLCYKGTCINATGKVAKVVTFSVALLVVVSGVVSLFDNSSK